MFTKREDRNIISKNVMSGLDIWESGKGHKVKVKEELQGGKARSRQCGGLSCENGGRAV